MWKWIKRQLNEIVSSKTTVTYYYNGRRNGKVPRNMEQTFKRMEEALREVDKVFKSL